MYEKTGFWSGPGGIASFDSAIGGSISSWKNKTLERVTPPEFIMVDPGGFDSWDDLPSVKEATPRSTHHSLMVAIKFYLKIAAQDLTRIVKYATLILFRS